MRHSIFLMNLNFCTSNWTPFKPSYPLEPPQTLQTPQPLRTQVMVSYSSRMR